MNPISVTLQATTVAPGDVLRGEVTTHADLANAVGLDVELRGEGEKNQARAAVKVRAHEGGCVAGERYPFELAVPHDTPPTYTGPKTSLAWKVVASLDVPWATDPSAGVEVQVVPGSVTRDRLDAYLAALKAAQDTRDHKPPACLVAVLVVILLVPGLALLAMIAPILLVVWVQARLIRTRLRDFKLELPERPLLLGEVVPARVTFLLRRPIEVEKIEVTFTGKEHWVTGSGKQQQHHYHQFHEETHELVGRTTVLAPEHRLQPARFRGEALLTVPAQPPGTVAGDRVVFEVKARAYLNGWPDPQETKKVVVAGARLADAQPAPAPPRPCEETSGGIVFVPEGERPPPDVDVAAAREAIWFWLSIPFVGTGLLALDLLLFFNARVDLGRELGASEPHLGAWVGLAVLVAGAAGVAWRVLR